MISLNMSFRPIVMDNGQQHFDLLLFNSRIDIDNNNNNNNSNNNNTNEKVGEGSGLDR